MLLQKVLGVVFMVSGGAKMWGVCGFSRVVRGEGFSLLWQYCDNSSISESVPGLLPLSL